MANQRQRAESLHKNLLDPGWTRGSAQVIGRKSAEWKMKVSRGGRGGANKSEQV